LPSCADAGIVVDVVSDEVERAASAIDLSACSASCRVETSRRTERSCRVCINWIASFLAAPVWRL
jgi:hypothetical protein